MAQEIPQVVEQVLSTLKIIVGEAVEAFSKLYWTEWLDVLFWVGILSLLWTAAMKVLSMFRDEREVYVAWALIFWFLALVICGFFVMQLKEAIQAAISPTAYAIKELVNTFGN